ncbi:MAG: YbgC/FadM family acyl-CoA thioesterase [Deltaproteobacteria bacterium]|nr:YbgC/FadM family acyl-CoA thioesterase [Deltaproteobacteria bacterium]
MPRTHILPVSVYYEDTDFSGVVYYAKYLRYFEAARDEFFGMEELVRTYKETGIGFAVYKVEVTYREGARFGDRLEVRTTVNPESDYRILCDQQVWRVGGTQPLVKGLVHMVCLDANQKLVALPPWVLQHVQLRNA